MPIYEYSCKKCGDFEITQRMSDGATEEVPNLRHESHETHLSIRFPPQRQRLVCD